MSQTGRNVFEQARVRRESVRHPIVYYDITEAGIRRVSGPEANRRIDRIVRALRSWGIKKGDRVALSREILARMGVPAERQFLGTLNAGHPGGMLPLDLSQRDTLHSDRLPGNLYVADATILPESMGNPLILTIMALAKKMASLV